MVSPLVSIIIPAYNGGEHLAHAIQSVLEQTYPYFELLIVDDCSPEPAEEVTRQFDDRRIKCFRLEENHGAVKARKWGVDRSSGEIIAFLDQDDWFHPEKLHTHVAYLSNHPEITVTYNSRFEFDEGSKSIHSIWVAPQKVRLADLVLGFPFSPSDTVLRREAALRDDIWDQSYVLFDGERIFNGGEIVFGSRLALAGYKFAHVGKALNYRRYHPQRVYKGLSSRCHTERTCQEMILNDPRCPKDVQALRDQALMNTYLVWSYYAFAQDETEVGQRFLREALRLNPELIEDQPCSLVIFWVTYTAMDWSIGIEKHLDKLFSQLPAKMAQVSTQRDWALARSYLVRGIQAIFWDHNESDHSMISRAIELGAEVDEPYIQDVVFQLMAYQNEFGEDASEKILRNLASALRRKGRQTERLLKGTYRINQAQKYFHDSEFRYVPDKVYDAIRYKPGYLLNRGVLAILYRSTYKQYTVLHGKHQ